MSSTRKHRGPVDHTPYMIFGAIAVLAVVLGVLWTSVAITAAISPAVAPPTPNPFTFLFELLFGKRSWPGTMTTIIAAGELGALGAAGAGAWRIYHHRRRHATRVDVSARHMATRRELEALSERGALATAARLGTRTPWPGVQIGRTIASPQTLYGSVEDMHIDIWGPRTGKALAADTPVLTPHGWTPIEDLTPGCPVIGSDGRPTTVTGVYRQGIRPAYLLRCSDGALVRCDGNHLWSVHTTGQSASAPLRTLTTRKMLRRGLYRVDGRTRYRLPLVAPVHLNGPLPAAHPPHPCTGDAHPTHAHTPPASGSAAASPGHAMPLDPYLLGVLLGAGALSGPGVQISIANGEDLLAELQPLLPPGIIARPTGGARPGWTLTTPRGSPTHCNPLHDALAQLGLLARPAPQTFVPPAYLLACPDTRIALLQGLLETGAFLGRRTHLTFATDSAQLAVDVRFLVQSLGGLATTPHRWRGSARQRLNMHLPLGFAPFRRADAYQRWQARTIQYRPRPPHRAITAIHPYGHAEMVCISVAATDGLFVINGCIVTHNTTSRAVPAIVDAPGGCLVTSNKRDVVDATRGVREKVGKVWIFDPQGLVAEPPSWWWDPLSYVTDVDKATRLAALFSSYGREAGARTDAYFDPEGEALLAYMLLAAASGGDLPVTIIYRWLNDPTDTTPVDLLRQAGHELPAEGVQGAINMPDKQRGGVFGTAKKSVACLVNPIVTRWVTPTAEPRPQFDPAAFVRSRATLYSLSQEGRAVAGPLVAALAVATIEAAEDLATTSPGGRLSVPFLGVLDEAANVCRWKELPNLYSHYGSRGIILMTILQSYAQGIEAWGEQGIAKLWGAANIRVYGGGAIDPKFLSDLSTLVGDFEPSTTSTSISRGQGSASRSTTLSTRPEKILDPSDLFALPKGRAMLFPSGARAVLVETLPWHNGPHAEAIRASLATYAPEEDLPGHELDPPHGAPA